MTEIEKLYSLVGVEKHKTHHKDYEDWFWAYPPLTAEKQIELIKFVGTLGQLEILQTLSEHNWIIRSDFNLELNTYRHSARNKCFEESLASLVMSIWQDLTEAEQNEIREILK